MVAAAPELARVPVGAASRTALLFTVCFILAQADKQVMGLLAIPVQSTFMLSDAELGFLQGGAFAIAFAIGGLPIARLLDRGNRVQIAAACVALWSFATILCGLAFSFLTLVLLRAATAVAEAGLPPAALSIFSQSGSRRVTARLTSAFMIAPFIGGGLILLLGGWVMEAFGETGGFESWRLVFFAVGLPGLVLAPLLTWLGHEPSRFHAESGNAPLRSYRHVLRAIFAENRFLRFYYPGLAAFYLFFAALIGWYPAFLVREHGLAPAAAGAFAGPIFLVAGIAGTLAATVLTSLRGQVSIAGLAKDATLAVLLLLPVCALLPLVDPLGWSLSLYALNAFISAGLIALMVVPIQLSLENAIQARGLAIFSLLMSAFAGSAGPLLVGLLSDLPNLSLGMALALTGAASSGLAGLLLFLAARAARAGVDDPAGIERVMAESSCARARM